MATLIDAVCLLDKLDNIPPFQCWLVGGNSEEEAYLRNLPLKHHGLKKLYKQGRWLAWGRVEPTALAELYSRSLVTVVPSHFEQFGLVAIESMVCGTPVIAAKSGGLEETVVPGITGETFPVDNSAALADVLSAYLRNPQKSVWQGTNSILWGKQFDSDYAFSRLYSVVSDGKDLGNSLKPTSFNWRKLVVSEFLPEVEQLVAHPMSSYEDVSGNSQITFSFKKKNTKLCCKLITPRPHTLTSMLPLPVELFPPVEQKEIVHRYRLFDNSDLCPKLVASSDDGIILSEWLPERKIDYPEKELHIARYFINEFSDFGQKLAESHNRKRLQGMLDGFEVKCSLSDILEVDMAAAKANSILTGGVERFHRIHPQLEMHRIRLLLEKNTWVLDPSLITRLKTVVVLVLETFQFVPGQVQLCHGSLKPVHVLQNRDQLVVCDLDNSVYAAGPLDVIHWLYSDGRLLNSLPIPDAVVNLRKIFADDEEFILGVGWLIVFTIYKLINCTLHGDLKAAHVISKYLSGICEAMHGIN